jgi:hypothetical protein
LSNSVAFSIEEDGEVVYEDCFKELVGERRNAGEGERDRNRFLRFVRRF